MDHHSSTLIGCLYQCIPWGFMLPLYKALYLITSPLAFAPTARALGVADHKAQLAALPLSLAVGLVVPTILNALPEPWSSPFAQQAWLAFWQFFPLWVAACQETAAFIARFFVGGDGSPATLLPSLRRAYMFPLAVGAAVHWGVILLSINPAFFAPLLALVPGGVVLPAMPSLAAIFVPKLKPAPDGDLLVHGCLTLLQADMYCAGAAALLWACALRRPGLFAPSDPRKRVGGSAGRVRAMAGLFGSALIRTLLLGPFGAALELLWERDEAVLKENADAAVAKKGQ